MNCGLEMNSPPTELIALLRLHAGREGVWQPTLYAKGRLIERREAAPPRLVIVEEGLVKLSFVSTDGNERVKAFIVAEGLFDQIGAAGEPIVEATCLEPTRAITLPLSWARTLASSHADVQRAVDAFWLWLNAKKRLRESALLCSTPLDRYRAFQTDEAALAARISQGDTARYLGVTPIAFSRIKRRSLSPSGFRS